MSVFDECTEFMTKDEIKNVEEHLGGTRIYIPVTTHGGCLLKPLLDEDTYRKIVDFVGGEAITIPNRKQKKLTQSLIKRNKKIIEEYDAGSKIRDLALKYRLTERSIYTILSQSY